MTTTESPLDETAERVARAKERLAAYVAEMPTVDELAKPIVDVCYLLHEMADMTGEAELHSRIGPSTDGHDVVEERAALVQLLEGFGNLVEHAVASCTAGPGAARAGADVRRALHGIAGFEGVRASHYYEEAWNLGRHS